MADVPFTLPRRQSNSARLSGPLWIESTLEERLRCQRKSSKGLRVAACCRVRAGPRNPPGPENPPCPTCERRMVVRQVMPVLFASGVDDVVYGCEKCGTEAKRTIKRT